MKRTLGILGMTLAVTLGVAAILIEKACDRLRPLSSNPSVREIGSYYQGRTSWKVILIPDDLSTERLIELARDIHRRRPNTYFELYDSDSQIAALLAWEDKPSETVFPVDYVRQHRKGIIGHLIDSKKNGWYLYKTSDDINSLQFDHKFAMSAPESNIISQLD